MLKNLMLIDRQSQIRELGTNLNYRVLSELIRSPLTCQQLATIFSLPKQKIHYNLGKLQDEGLIEIAPDYQPNQKEIYYRATAKNYVLAYSIGLNIDDNILNNRGIINTILSNDHGLSLQDIAVNLLENSLMLKPKERLLIVTGKYNLPLVEKIMLEAGRRSVLSTLIYQEADAMRSKYEEYSLAAFNADYENFNQILSQHDVFINLNGESRFLQLSDPEKIRLRIKHFEKSRQIIAKNKIRMAIMPGLLNNTLTENSIDSELQFWQALDIDYSKLSERTTAMCKNLEDNRTFDVNSGGTSFYFEVDKITADTGSFSGSEYQSHVINLPGGEILLVPKPGSMNGSIKSSLGYAFGEKIINPEIVIRDNEIISFKAEENEHLIAKAIAQGGPEGRKVALICLGTNDNVRLENIDLSYKHKMLGLMTVYWGENTTQGGTVEGASEWFIQIEEPVITNK
ncbi:MAG TPA: aminopeptidase [Candidatus Cloacimonadota bacterium]|nr:aminopeptidase [Candidatus Cloacimonadota bacterium]